MSTPDDRPERDEPMWRRYLRFHRSNPVADLDDELRDHLESAEAALVSRGWSAERAHDEAHRRFGNVARIRREVVDLDRHHHRRTRLLEHMHTFWQDLRYGVRGLTRAPGMAIVAILSIALAIAANGTVFSIVNALLLRPIPGATSERLVRVYENHHSPFAWDELHWFRERTRSLDALIGERYGAMSLRTGATAPVERARTSYVTRGYFGALGVRPALGRFFEGDEAAGADLERVVVLSHEYWRTRFGSDSGVVGRAISLAGHPMVVAGVAPAGFRSSVMGWTPQVFVPLAVAPMLTGTKLEEFGGSLYATGRLRSGVTAAQADAEMRVLMVQLARTDTARYERRTVRLDHTRGVNAELRAATAAGSAFGMLMVGVVLLIACANVANLLLGRAASRQSEIGVRVALGAARGRIVRQLLTESLVLAGLGTVLGGILAVAVTRIIVAAIPAEAGIDRAFFAPDIRVVAFNVVLCVATTLLFGLVPALRASSPGITAVIRSAPPAGIRQHRRRGGLVATQVALCLLTLALASLFWRSLRSMRGLDTGFVASDVVDVTLDLGLLAVDDTTRQAMFARLLDGARRMPGVHTATLAALVPLGGSNMETRVLPEGLAATSRFEMPMTYFNVVGPDYFETLRMPLRAGRGFRDTDRDGTPAVAVVNETAAHRWWPGASPVGKRVRWGGTEGPLLEIVGVAADADYVMPGETRKPLVFVPFAQQARGEMVLQLHVDGTVAAIREQVWALVRGIAPALPPPPVTSMQEDMAITLLPVRMGSWLLAVLGTIAMLLASAGIYGVAAYAVARRRRELGIRAALGAERGRLLRLVVREHMRPVVVGIAVGMTLTVAAAFALSRVLYGVHALDPIVLPLTAIGLAMVALAATFVPAWRAAGTQPVIAMRSE